MYLLQYSYFSYMILVTKQKMLTYYFGILCSKRHISLTDTYLPTGDIDTDIQFIKNYYKGVNAKYPEKFCTD